MLTSSEPAVSTGLSWRTLGDAFPLAAAAALCGPCDLATLDQLRRDLTPHLPFMALQRIQTLRGAEFDGHRWTFSRALKLRMVARLGVDFHLRVLEWQSRRLERAVAPAGTRAAMVRHRELALLRWQIAILRCGPGETPSIRTVLPILEALELHLADPRLSARLVEETRLAASMVPKVEPPWGLGWRIGRLGLGPRVDATDGKSILLLWAPLLTILTLATAMLFLHPG